MKLLILIATILLLPPPNFAAQELRGAQAIIEEVQSASTPPPGSENTPVAQLKAKIQNFKTAQSRLKPDQSAANWLALADQYFQLPAADPLQRLRGSAALSFPELFAVLPGPETWPDLVRLVSMRPAPTDKTAVRELVFRALISSLAGDYNQASESIKSAETLSRKASSNTRAYISYGLPQLKNALISISDSPTDRKQMIEDQLSFYETTREQESWRIPDLVLLIGREEAQKVLRRALVLPTARLSFGEGKETKALARQVALGIIDKIVIPPWDLVDAPQALALYEALNKKFPEVDQATIERLQSTGAPGVGFGQDNYERLAARQNYLLGLVLAGRREDASKLLLKLQTRPDDFSSALAFSHEITASEAGKVADFLAEFLPAHPQYPLWELYVSTASVSGQTATMLTNIKTILQDGAITDEIKQTVRQQYYPALLSADQVDDAVLEMSKLINGEEGQDEGGSDKKDNAILSLAKLGAVLDKPEWLQQALTAWQNRSPKSSSSPYLRSVSFLEVATLLISKGEFPQAEAIITAELKHKNAPEFSIPGYSEGGNQLLVTLASLYTAAGRSKDVLLLMDSAPWWNVGDLAEIHISSGEYTRHEHQPEIHYLAAKALAAENRTEEAIAILKFLLLVRPGYDPAYDLLISLQKEAALPFLDQLFQMDKFEERPLIWKAAIFKTQNKLDEAEKLLRQAIAIDPSDGEQGPPDRMRAYSFLADVLAAKGNNKDAAVFQNAVKAIRLSEQADTIYSAGLVSRALKMYEQSLNIFADAYCIQSRLALRYTQLGMEKAAEEHYQRAYELMPESFGRVESHCFGCEGVFDNPKGQTIAERVFTRLVSAQPNKPQIHYLLGYLKAEQGRFEEASASINKAVTLDPDYLNAWKKLQDLQEHLLLPVRRRDEIILNILRLDPLARHVSPNVSKMSDLPSLWKAAEKAAALVPVTPKQLLPLTVSQRVLEEKKKSSKNSREEDFESRIFEYSNRFAEKHDPASVVAEQEFIQSAIQFFSAPFE